MLPQKNGPVENACCLARPVSLQKPEECSKERWQVEIKDKWQQVSQPVVPDKLDQGTVDELWRHFCTNLECVLPSVLGMRRMGVTKRRVWIVDEQLQLLARAKGKNKLRMFKTPVAKGTALQPWSSFRERKLRKLAYRLSELRRLGQLGRRHMPEYSHLWRLVRRFPGLPQGATAELHDYACKLLERFRS